MNTLVVRSVNPKKLHRAARSTPILDSNGPMIRDAATKKAASQLLVAILLSDRTHGPMNQLLIANARRILKGKKHV